MLTFDAALARLTAEEFVERILVERFAVSGAVIGFNFHFGVSRAGSPDFLTQGKRHGFVVDVVPPLQDNGLTVARIPFATRSPPARSTKRRSCSAIPGSCRVK